MQKHASCRAISDLPKQIRLGLHDNLIVLSPNRSYYNINPLLPPHLNISGDSSTCPFIASSAHDLEIWQRNSQVDARLNDVTLSTNGVNKSAKSSARGRLCTSSTCKLCLRCFMYSEFPHTHDYLHFAQ